MAMRTTPYDAAEFLTDSATIAAYLSEAIASGDAVYVVKALGNLARARNMSKVARQAGVSRACRVPSKGRDA
jgi:probable addiction module antidote protein